MRDLDKKSAHVTSQQGTQPRKQFHVGILRTGWIPGYSGKEKNRRKDRKNLKINYEGPINNIAIATTSAFFTFEFC